MDIFEWQDGTIIERPYVEINGTKYYVQNANISGGVPVSSSNLNAMQLLLNQNINDKFNGRFIKLWENNNPQAISSLTNITFESSDYDIIRVLFRISLNNDFVESIDFLKGYSTRMIGATLDGTSLIRPLTRNSDTSYTIGISTAGSENNIPILILGYKFEYNEGDN